MYLALGGSEALDAIAADYRCTMEKWSNQLSEYNAKVGNANRKTQRQNAKIRANNQKMTDWNELHPDQPARPLLFELSIPSRTVIQFDLSSAYLGAQTDVPAKEMSLINIAVRVDQLLDKAGDDLAAEAIYVVAFRALSTFATHVTLPLLDSYLSRDAWFIKVTRQSNTPTSAQSFTRNALQLTAILARRVLSMNNTEAPISAAIEFSAHNPNSGTETNGYEEIRDVGS